MTSNEAKEELCNYVASQSSQYMGGVWESTNHWNADFIAVKWTGSITEFEIKVSRNDLAGEVKAIRRAIEKDSVQSVPTSQYNLFAQGRVIVNETKLSRSKIEKHHHYLVSQRPLFRPNLFYFAVPSELVQYAIELTAGTKYGVFDLSQKVVTKKATSLHSDPHSSRTLLHLFSRACTIRYDRLVFEPELAIKEMGGSDE